MSRRRKDRKTRQARGQPNADGRKPPPAGPQARRTDASMLERRHVLLLYMHHLHTGKSVDEIAASFGIDPDGLRERFEFTERVVDKILPAGKTISERIQKRLAARGQEAGKGPA